MRQRIPISKPTITQSEVRLVTDAVQSGWVSSLGKYLTKFESNFAKYCQTKYALSTSNGTVGLHLALAGLGIKEGDEVIIPDLTFIATANAVRYIGAKIVTVDVDRQTLCIDPEQIKRSITKRTKAIIPVHLYGHPADMIEIVDIAKENNLLVIEDAAEAHGAKINGTPVGSFGHCGVFSFYGNKIITSGEGGMITTDSKILYDRLVFLRDHAMSKTKRYWHTEMGFNYRMTNLQAALGYGQLKRINQIIKKKCKIFEWYQDELKNVNSVKLNSTKEGYDSVYWMVAIEIAGISNIQRDDLLAELSKRGIESRPYFYPISDMCSTISNATPVTHEVSKIGLNVPSFYDITRKEVKYICEELIDILKRNYIQQ